MNGSDSDSDADADAERATNKIKIKRLIPIGEVAFGDRHVFSTVFLSTTGPNHRREARYAIARTSDALIVVDLHALTTYTVDVHPARVFVVVQLPAANDTCAVWTSTGIFALKARTREIRSFVVSETTMKPLTRPVLGWQLFCYGRYLLFTRPNDGAYVENRFMLWDQTTLNLEHDFVLSSRFYIKWPDNHVFRDGMIVVEYVSAGAGIRSEPRYYFVDFATGQPRALAAGAPELILNDTAPAPKETVTWPVYADVLHGKQWRPKLYLSRDDGTRTLLGRAVIAEFKNDTSYQSFADAPVGRFYIATRTRVLVYDLYEGERAAVLATLGAPTWAKFYERDGDTALTVRVFGFLAGRAPAPPS